MESIGGSFSIRQIFLCRNAWFIFWAKNITLLRWAVVWNVCKMLLCRTGWGYVQYSCLKCGITRRVPHTCKSRFCSSCGKAAVDRWVETTISSIIDVPYQHLIFTIPQELRDWIRMNRKHALNALFGAVKDTLLTWTNQRGYKPGIIMVLHSFGADLKWNPHIHTIITCGGISLDEKRWISNHYIPWQCLRPMFRYAFLQKLKNAFASGKLKPPPIHKNIGSLQAFNSWLSPLYHKEWFLHLGKSLQNAAFTVRYVGRYGKRPVIAEYNISAFDGQAVTFQYKDRATGEIASLTLGIQDFIGRLVQHIPELNFRILRHAGIFANRIRTPMIEKARALLAQAPKPPPRRISWRKLFIKTFHKDPLVCPNCNTPMELTKVAFTKTIDIRLRVIDKHSKLLNSAYVSKTPTSAAQTQKKKREPAPIAACIPRAPPRPDCHLSLPQM